MRPSCRLSAFALVLAILLVSPLCVVSGVRRQQIARLEPTLGLEIKLPGGQVWRHGIEGRGLGLIARGQLKIIDEAAAADFTAVDVVSEAEPGAIRVNLFVIYNDIKNQEWWKDKKQKPAGSYLIRERESVSAADLAQFGIEPIELSVIDARPVVITPPERPFITNKTQSLEVVRLERSLDHYTLTIKNISDRTIARFTVTQGGSGHSTGYSSGGLRPGSVSEGYLGGSGIEAQGITISSVIFEDGSFEGDAQKEALAFLAEREGQRIQAPSVLARIVQTMQVADAELPDAFDKLEAGLWTIPEAIDKQSALDLLKSEYPHQDDREISRLYESLKGGLYKARNLALTYLGQLKRSLQEDQRLQNSHRVARIRSTLTDIKASLERIVAVQVK
jgi:hypothetical protein